MNQESNYLESAAKCTRCGNCQYFCPTYNASRVESFTARGRLQLVRSQAGQPDAAFSDTFVKRMNQCLLCGNCSSICPSGIQTEAIIEAVRADCVRANGPSTPLGLTRDNIARAGSITGDAPANRLLWFKNIEDKLAGMKINERAEYAYLTGCVPALYPSSYSIPQSFVLLLRQAGIDFTLVGDTENCCGYPLLIGGLPAEARAAAERNVANLARLGVRKIITTCPSCYHMWHDLYPELLGRPLDLQIIHGTQLLASLLQDGRLALKETKRVVTFHDPCDLGRKSGEYDAPRAVLQSIPGVQYREMKHAREDSRCCGGGGNMEMNDAALGGKVAQDRVRQALETGADTIVTACQQCKRTLMGGARQMKARIKVMDISEILSEAVSQS